MESEEAVPVFKKYRVSGSTHRYEVLETNSIEEALSFAAGLVGEGFASVVISDNESMGSDW